MYIFAKFVSDHIFLQNRDKLNIKKKFASPLAVASRALERVASHALQRDHRRHVKEAAVLRRQSRRPPPSPESHRTMEVAAGIEGEEGRSSRLRGRRGGGDGGGATWEEGARVAIEELRHRNEDLRHRIEELRRRIEDLRHRRGAGVGELSHADGRGWRRTCGGPYPCSSLPPLREEEVPAGSASSAQRPYWVRARAQGGEKLEATRVVGGAAFAARREKRQKVPRMRHVGDLGSFCSKLCDIRRRSNSSVYFLILKMQGRMETPLETVVRRGLNLPNHMRDDLFCESIVTVLLVNFDDCLINTLYFGYAKTEMSLDRAGMIRNFDERREISLKQQIMTTVAILMRFNLTEKTFSENLI
jgi:hypothetical protein